MIDIEQINFIDEPCPQGADWLATQPDWQSAWRNCHRGDWMFWILGNLKGLPPLPRETCVELLEWIDKEQDIFYAHHSRSKASRVARFQLYLKKARTAPLVDSRLSTVYDWTSYVIEGVIHDFENRHSITYCDNKLHLLAEWIREHIPCPELPKAEVVQNVP